MRIFDETKTQELNANELDFEKGYLKADRLATVHYEATPAVKGRSAEEVYAVFKAEGRPVIEINGQPYLVMHIFKNHEEVPYTPGLDLNNPIYGKSVIKIEAEPDTPAKEAYDEYEEIKVYVLYTEAELKEWEDKKKHTAYKAELAKVMEDIEQEQLGIVRDDYAEKKARATWLINELRVLEGKEPREVKK